jgi:hypothetical protein
MKGFKKFTAGAGALIVTVMLALPVGILAQTRVEAPKNKYSVSDDVKLGRDAAMQAERQLPVLNNGEVHEYINSVGERLVYALPSEFQHPEFRYSFKVVNARDINAFALPGGFMYVNRGLIEVARNEGELAGVMAHELSHVALRHGTAQATKAQPYAIGSVIGQVLGAVVGGGLGQVIGAGAQIVPGVFVLKYSRDYERQADMLGAQIMARAGYDPRDLANMFRTIEQQSGGGGGPEWMSSHPNPGNRYDAIIREAQMLRIEGRGGDNNQFARIQRTLRDMPRARSMQEIGREGNRYPTSDDRYPDNRYPNDRYPTGRVDYPSNRYRVVNAGSYLQLSVPDNWREFSSGSEITFAPEGAYGNYQGRAVLTHGAMVGIANPSSRNLQQATNEFVNSLAQGNGSLRQSGGYRREAVGNRNGLSTVLVNRSEVTGRNEAVVVYTTMLRNGGLFYIIGVAPQNEYQSYQNAFYNIARSVRFND